jgi:hypothetical protein
VTTPTTVQVRLQIRADTAANWTSVNPILLTNELGLETDTKKFKVGDGTTVWNSLAYFPSIVSGGTVLGNLEIGTTGTLTFEGSTANDFETTLGVVDPTADRTILLPDQSGTVVIGGNASITDADIAANAEIAVSKLANGTANQVLVTDGTDVSWSDNLTLAGDLTVNGTTTTINTETLTVKDKNIELAVVDTPTDVTADGGGITLKGTTDKTINWVDATDAWTSSEHVNIASGKEYRIAGTKVLDATSLGSGVLITSANITDGTIVDADVNASAAIAGTKISPDFGAQNVTTTGTSTAASFIPTSSTVPTNGIYSPGADQLALSTNGTGRLFVDASGNIKQQLASAANGGLNVNDGTNDLIAFGTGGFAANGGSATDGGIRVTNNLVFATGTGAPERMRLDSSGRLGLGTSSPDAKLHVSGNDGLIVSSFNPNTGLRLNYGNSNGEISAINLIANGITNGYIGMQMVDGSTGDLWLGGSGSRSMTLYRDGKVGIGDNGPDSTLTIKAATGVTPFKVSGPSSEFAKIDSSGRLLVGTSSGPLINESQIGATGAGNTACFKTTVSSNNPLLLWNSATSGDNIFVSFFTETSYTARGVIDYNRAAGQVRYNTTSDQRLKSNIQDSESSLNILGQIKVRSYDWAETGHSILYGFVAQELHQAVPDAVKVGDSGDEVINAWAVDNSKLVPLLTKALQEAMERIEILEAKVETLEGA